MDPLVSIIVPNFNHEKFLEERMHSIFGQTFQDYELILLDDASTDRSPEMLKEYSKHPKVAHMIVNEKNSGSPFAQWKKGFELARGKYVWIAESDDSSTPEFLSSLVEIMEKNDNMAVCYSGGILIDEDGKPMDRDYNRWNTKKLMKRLGSCKVHNGEDFIRRNLYWSCYIYNASGALIRKDRVTSDMFDDSMKMKNSGDWLIWNKIAKRGDVGELYKKLNITRIHENSATEKGAKDGNLFEEDSKVISYIERHNKIGLYRRIIRHGFYIKTVSRLDRPEARKKEILETFYRETGGGLWEFKLERTHRVLMHIIPGLLTMKRDRL